MPKTCTILVFLVIPRTLGLREKEREKTNIKDNLDRHVDNIVFVRIFFSLLAHLKIFTFLNAYIKHTHFSRKEYCDVLLKDVALP